MRHAFESLLLLSLAAVLLRPALATAQEAPQDSTQEATQEKDAPEAGKQFTEPGQNGAVLDDMVVEAQNEVRQGVEKTSFEFDLSAAMIDSFTSAVDSEALEVSPVSGLKPHLNNLEDLASNQTPHLWLQEIPSTPVATFYPEPEPGRKIESWDLTITDFQGSPFQTFEGNGAPPHRLEWDGRSSDGRMLRTGYPYSYVFSQTDKGTNTYNHAGVSFRLPALDYDDGDDRVLELSGNELFQRGDAQPRSDAERWLVKATDIMRQHPYSPFEVVCVAEDAQLAEARATAVAKFLAQQLVLPQEQIEVAFEQKSDLRSEMDGQVKILIRHAD
jgi:flagellar motor protein MotB